MTVNNILFVFGSMVAGFFGGAQGGDIVSKVFGPEAEVRGIIAGCFLGTIGGLAFALGSIKKEQRHVQDVRIVPMRDPLQPFRRQTTRAERRRRR
jgi:hypothetical protein